MIELLRAINKMILIGQYNKTLLSFFFFGTVGFISSHTITVNESAGAVNIVVGLISGKLCGQVEISFSNGTSSDAIGRYIRIKLVHHHLLLSIKY